MRSAEGSVRSSDVHAPAVDAAAAGPHEHGAGLADQPDAERAALEHEAGARVQVARLVADEVAEQAERRALRPAVRARPRGAARSRRAWRTARGSPTRARAGRTRPARPAARAHSSTPDAASERDRVRDRRERPQPRAAVEAALVDPRPPVDGRGLGKDRSALRRRSPARDRAAQDHELGVERQLVDLPRVPLALVSPRRSSRRRAARGRRPPPPPRPPRPPPSTPRASCARCGPCGSVWPWAESYAVGTVPSPAATEGGQSPSPPSCSRIRRLTSPPSALPFVSRMTGPTSAPIALGLPPRMRSTTSGLSSITLATMPASSPESPIAPRSSRSTISAGSPPLGAPAGRARRGRCRR